MRYTFGRDVAKPYCPGEMVETKIKLPFQFSLQGVCYVEDRLSVWFGSDWEGEAFERRFLTVLENLNLSVRGVAVPHNAVHVGSVIDCYCRTYVYHVYYLDESMLGGGSSNEAS